MRQRVPFEKIMSFFKEKREKRTDLESKFHAAGRNINEEFFDAYEDSEVEVDLLGLESL